MRVDVRSFVAGILSVVIIGAIAGYVVIANGFIPANADAAPSRFETRLAHMSLNATLAREAPSGDGPVAFTPAAAYNGAVGYAQNCAVCHGGAGNASSAMGLGEYPHAPQFGKHGVSDDPIGETFWKIQHGIRLTGMPAFKSVISEKQQWEIALFLKHMDALPPAAEAKWKSISLSH